MDSTWKVKAVLKVTGITLTEKYTSLKIKLVGSLFRAYISQSEATHILEQETLSDSEDSDDSIVPILITPLNFTSVHV